MSAVTVCVVVIFTSSCFVVPETVYGTKGSSIIFICPYKKVLTNNVIWEFVYNVSTTSTISDGDFISSSPLYARVSIVGDHTAGEYNLHLSNLRESDEVIFRCCFMNLTKEYNLELLAPPSSVIIQDVTMDKKILGTEGQGLILRCTAVGGKPPPLVTITVDNVVRSSNQTVEYTISTLQRRHDRQMVRCDANSSALTSALAANAALYLYLKPIQPTFNPDPVIIEETKPMVVSCTSTGSRPAATFQWTIGVINVTPNSTTQTTITADDTFTVTSTLRRNVDRAYNGQTITCTAMNTVATNDVKAIKTLDIKFALYITVTNVTYDQNTATRTVTCEPVGNPTTYTYFGWLHKSTDGVHIRELDGGQNGILTFPSVPVEDRYQDSGEYICTASNGIIGRDGKLNQTGSGYVTINAQPVFTNGNKDTEYGEFGKNVGIHVYVYSRPKYTLVKWYKSSTEISMTANKYTLSETTAMVPDVFHGIIIQLEGYRVTLTIKNLVESDFNVSYSVELSNGVGQAVGYTSLLASASAPQTPILLTPFKSTEESVVVQWKPGYNGGNEQTFYIEYCVYGSNTWISIKILDYEQSGIQIYTLSGLYDNTVYELRMYAENKFNKSGPTETVAVQTNKVSQSLSAAAVVGGVVGGISAILVVVIAVLLIKKKGLLDGWRKKNVERTSTPNYDTLGVKDNLNMYEEMTTKNAENTTYEPLSEKDKPSVYEDLSNEQVQRQSGASGEYYDNNRDNSKSDFYENVTNKTGKDDKVYINIQL